MSGFDDRGISSTEGANHDDAPDFGDLFDDGESPADLLDLEDDDRQEVADSFQKIDRVLEDPKEYFRNANFYQEILIGEGEIAKRVHATLAAFLKAEDPEDRSAQRQRLVPLVWELAKSIAKRAHADLGDPKRLFLRYGLLLPTMIDKEQRLLLAQIPAGNGTGQPIHYVDEWLRMVAIGQVNASATDETKPTARNQGSRVAVQVESSRGKVEAQLELIKTHNREMLEQEETLQKLVGALVNRDLSPLAEGERGPYSESQRSLFTDIGTVLRKLSNQGRDLARNFNELERYQEIYEAAKREAAELGLESAEVDTQAAADEMGTVRQMAKMAVGRQGNHFPLLFKQYFRGGIIGMATRENVNNVLAHVEYLDPSVFKRTFKQKTTRIVPNIVLVPCYGETGICWEPFERYNRATSRGRLAVPMYPKDVKVAVIAAIADLRWQVAKERAAHYWMEEGLTGWYYQWFSELRMKGDVKDQFVQDYILWLTKESEGTQKLAREVRDIFWRYIPFPQEIKDELKNRGFVYSELYKKDQNRAMSDGY